MTRFVPDDVRIERRLRRSSSIPHRGRTFRALTRALIGIFVWTALPADALADLSVQTRIPLAEWHAVMRKEMAIEYRCVKPTKPEAAIPPGRRRAPADITPRQMLISRKPAPTTLHEALEQGYVCEEIPRSRRMLVSWERDSASPRETKDEVAERVTKTMQHGLSRDGKARIPIEEWRADVDSDPERLWSLPENINYADLLEGLQPAIGGEKQIRLRELSTREVDRIGRSKGATYGADARPTIENLLLDLKNEGPVEKLLETQFVFGTTASPGSSETLHARQTRRDEQCARGIQPIEPVSCGSTETLPPRHRINDDVRVYSDDHSRAIPRDSSNSRSMSSFVRVPGGRVLRNSERLGRGFFASRSSRCRSDSFLLLRAGSVRPVGREGMKFSGEESIAKVLVRPTPDPGRAAIGMFREVESEGKPASAA